MIGAIIRNVVGIILKHAKPERIYLYGSRVNGESKNNSDIDIAYEDAHFSDNALIESDVEKLDTLLKIDVKNLARVDERFKNRVKSTGRVIYSSSKKLRAEDGLFNFNKALERFRDVIRREETLKNEGFGDIYLDVIVKRFEFTYEMAWKAIKRLLDFMGIQAQYPRICFKEAYAQGIIDDENVWLEMIEMRNLSAHVYDESEIAEVLDKLDTFVKAFVRLEENMQKRIEKG